MRRYVWFSVLALVLLNAVPAWASELRQGTDCFVETDYVAEGNLYALCRSLIIDGQIDGDLWAASITTIINGEITGSIYVLSGKLDVNGSIGGSIHFGGGILTVNETAALTNSRANLYSASLSTELNSPLSGQLAGIGYQLIINAPVGGGVDFAGTSLVINAPIDGTVNASTGDPQRGGVNELESLIQLVDSDANLVPPGLVVTENGAVGGTLIYRAPVEADIQGNVANIQYTPLLPDSAAIVTQQDIPSGIGAYFQQVIREFVIISLIGLIALFFAPRSTQMPLPTLRSKPAPSIGLGLIAFILSFPIVVISIVFSLLIVLVLSLLNINQLILLTLLILAILNVALIGAFYFMALFVSRMLAALALGRFVTRLVWREARRPGENYLYLLVGSFVLALLSALPFIGSFIIAISAFLGLGAIIYSIQAPARRIRSPIRASAERMGSPLLPPPPLDDIASVPGADNLPEGFNWWQ